MAMFVGILYFILSDASSTLGQREMDRMGIVNVCVCLCEKVCVCVLYCVAEEDGVGGVGFCTNQQYHNVCAL